MSVKTLYLMCFVDALGFAFLLPLTNTHILALKGSSSIIGLLASLSSGLGLIVTPIIGSWSDTQGRKLLYIYCLCGTLVSHILLPTSSLVTFFVSRLIFAGSNHGQTLLRALVADIVPKDGQSRVFGNFNAVMGVAFIICPIAGGYLYEIYKGFSAIVVILCTAVFINIGTLLIFINEDRSKENESNESSENTTTWKTATQGITKVFSNIKNVDWNKYGDILLLKLFLEASFSTMFGNFSLILATKFLVTRKYMGVIVAFLSIINIVASLAIPFVQKNLYSNDKNGLKQIFHGFIVLLACFCSLPFSNALWIYLSFYIPIWFAKGLLDTTCTDAITKRTSDKDKGVMMGVSSSVISLAGLVCPLLNGVLSDLLGLHVVSFLPVIPAFIGTYLARKYANNSITQESLKKGS